jgi:hypothetical protein
MSSIRHIKEEEKEYFEAIIAKNELTDPIIIEYLTKLHLAKKKSGGANQGDDSRRSHQGRKER